MKPIVPPSQSYHSHQVKHTSIPLDSSLPCSFTISLVSSSAILPLLPNHSISASSQPSTSSSSPISQQPSCTTLRDTHSFLDLEDPSFMDTLRSLSPVPSFALRFPRIRKDSHVAKSEAPSSSTLANAQLPARISSLNSCSHSFNDEHHTESRTDAGFSDATSQPSPTVTISRSSHWPARGSDATPFNSPTSPTFPVSDTDRDICEIIKQLEELTHGLKAMDVDMSPPRPPTRRLARPPPRFSSLPRSRHAMHIYYDSSSSSSHSQPPSPSSSAGLALSPVSESPPARLAYLGEDFAKTEPRAAVPRIVLTTASADELAEEPAESERPSSPPVGADGDEVEWLENYGRWGNDLESSSDDDCASVTSSILFDPDDASSMFTTASDSPPLLTPDVRLFPSYAYTLQFLTS